MEPYNPTIHAATFETPAFTNRTTKHLLRLHTVLSCCLPYRDITFEYIFILLNKITILERPVAQEGKNENLLL
jgi:hypothetical protein